MAKVQTLPLMGTNSTATDWPIQVFDFDIERKPPKQLLKWIGNKQRFAEQIASILPKEYNRYIEPFVGSGAVLGAMAPKKGVAGDALKPLIEMWKLIQQEPEKVYKHYEVTWNDFAKDREIVYKRILASFNTNPNPLDLVFISRSCYGGVVRFTKQGKMSTPLGPHRPIPPEAFKERVDLWRSRIQNTVFTHASYQETMSDAGDGDIVYCDPPYVDSQAILYGAQAFSLNDLWESISKAKSRGARVALSIDGHKKSGAKVVELDIPQGLFETQLLIDGGSSMLKRFQKKDQVMTGEDVRDRLLLTW
ncbi:MAG: Dam family site-specific DNA-(adenine-N6)-methyltransferase [Patescibacteria group bacterium]